MILKICVISENNWLEALLRQYSLNYQMVEQSLADITIKDDASSVNLILNRNQESFSLLKPISVSMLIAMIEQLEQKIQEESSIFQIGPVVFYPKQRLCKLDQEEINLTQKENDILLYLLEQKSEVDKSTLLHIIWGYAADVSTHTLETHIYNLRNKFAGKYELIISNESGYRLNFGDNEQIHKEL